MAEQQKETRQETSVQESSAKGQRPSSGTVMRPRISALLPFTPFTPYEVFAGGPFQVMRRMMEEMDHLVEAMNPSETARGTATSGLWSPAIEVARRDRSLVIKAELPGLSKDDVKVELTPDGLMIQGERKEEHEEKEDGIVRSERRYGKFVRLIPLPEGADADQANAQFKDGVLEVTIPVPEEKARRREIPINDESQSTMAKAA
jgi:HSP20 family protein